MKTLFLPLLFLISSWLGQPPLDDWRNKVDPNVLHEAELGNHVEFLIVLKEQADLSKSELFRNKEDKGQYVYEQLSDLAAGTQKNIVAKLKDFNAPYRSFWIINSLWAKGNISLIENLARLSEVREIQSNPTVRFQEPVEISQNAPRNALTIEWGITKIKAVDVWAMGYIGQNVVIGGQDTGVDWEHPTIISKYRGSFANPVNHNYNWHDAIDTGTGNPCGVNTIVPCDDHNHGTHTVGTMVGDDGAGNQIGVAPGAKWIACRNMDQGVGTPATYIECFEWFVAPTNLNGTNPRPNHAPHVINNSWGCPLSEGCNSGNWALMQGVIANVRDAGIVVVASAGNSGSGCGTVNDPPAMFDESYSVGATNSSDGIASFSSRGPVTADGSNRLKPDVSAPGVSVRSCITNNGYATWSGTSMAGPHVAGAVALLISADPSLAGNVDQIELLLRENATGLTTTQNCGGVSGNSIPNNTFGYGRIDILAAVNAVMALPVELSDFRAKAKEKTIELIWKTASEYQNDHFVIERSTDLERWKEIGKVDAHGNGSSPANYQFEDRHPAAGVNYYRLKQMDRDGSFEHSKVVSANIEQQLEVLLYPNPFSNQLTLQFSDETKINLLRIYDLTGRIIFQTENVADNKLFIPTTDWARGVYYLVYSVNDEASLSAEELVKF